MGEGAQPVRIFTFQPRWKEEMVVTGPGGAFVLEMPMGITSVYLPTEAEWGKRAPAWARPLWMQLNAELEAWCRDNNSGFHIDKTAWVGGA